VVEVLFHDLRAAVDAVEGLEEAVLVEGAAVAQP
jgi:hypothetical protein